MRGMILSFVLAFLATALVLYLGGLYHEAWPEFMDLLREMLR